MRPDDRRLGDLRGFRRERILEDEIEQRAKGQRTKIIVNGEL